MHQVNYLDCLHLPSPRLEITLDCFRLVGVSPEHSVNYTYLPTNLPCEPIKAMYP